MSFFFSNPFPFSLPIFNDFFNNSVRVNNTDNIWKNLYPLKEEEEKIS